MLRLLKAGLCAGILLSPAALEAQGTPQPGDPGAAVFAGPAALVATPVGLALADTLLRALGFEDMARAGAMATFDAGVQQQPAMAVFRDIMEAWVMKHLTLAEMGPAMSQLYAETFTEDELRALVAFYRTPLGRQLARMSPKLAERGTMLGAAVGQRHAAELEAQMRGRMMELQSSGDAPE